LAQKNSDVGTIIDKAAELKADLAGITFHAGSQCTNINNWVLGIRAAREAFDEMLKKNLRPRLLNLGGGYPVTLSEPVPSIEDIGADIMTELDVFPDDVHIIAEPGRFLVSDTGYFVCRVVGTAMRQNQPWLYLDAGFYGGLMELDDIPYHIDTDRQGELLSWKVAGPSCCSNDAFKGCYELPSDLQANDFIYIKNAGAYTNSMSSTFNGFELPDVKVI